MTIEIVMPAMSPTMTEGKLAKWLKKEGDRITRGDVIAEVETDKATMEVEAVDEGVLAEILVPGGDVVAVNKSIARLRSPNDAAPVQHARALCEDAPQQHVPAPTFEPTKTALVSSPAVQPSEPCLIRADGDKIAATPLARRIAASSGIDLSSVVGTGPHGRIIRIDVDETFVARRTSIPADVRLLPAVSIPDYGQPFHAQANSSMRKIIARRLSEAKTTIPHFYLTVDCKIDDLLRLRAALNEKERATYKLSVNDFVVRASALALRKVPSVNATWTEESVRLYDNVDISVAVATPDGLITPIIHSVDHKGLATISNEMKDLVARARHKKLKPEEYQGGGFTISNLGMYGVAHFSAIINPPQAAILAVGKAEQRPVVKNGALDVATVMFCTLSCDHRVVDGAVGAEFLQAFQALIEDPIKMLL